MAKMTQNLQRKFKITNFLLGSGFRTRRLFVGIVMLHECTDFYTCTWNAVRGALRWKCIGGAIEPFCHTHFWNHIRRKFSPVLMRVQSFMTFRACLGPQKCDSFRRRIIIIIINEADSIGSSHHRCSGPNNKADSIGSSHHRARSPNNNNNNKQSRFKRVLTPSVLGP